MTTELRDCENKLVIFTDDNEDHQRFKGWQDCFQVVDYIDIYTGKIVGHDLYFPRTRKMLRKLEKVAGKCDT